MQFENVPELGLGIYTISEVSQILGIKYYKVHKWITEYWDKRLTGNFRESYSWVIDENNRAISFHTLIELYVFIQLSESGVKTSDILKAHLDLSKNFGTAFPFAQKDILASLKSDGKTVFFGSDSGVISLDGTRQLNLQLISFFFKNLDFDGDLLASRFWPLGKEKNIVVDPERQFGHPVVGKSNIYPETLHNLFKAGEPIDFISFTYEIEESYVKDAIEYCESAA